MPEPLILELEARRPTLPEPFTITLEAKRPELPEPFAVTLEARRPELSEPFAVTLEAKRPALPEPFAVTLEAKRPELPEPFAVTLEAKRPELPEPFAVTLEAERPELPEPFAVTLEAKRPAWPEPFAVTLEAERPALPEPFAVTLEAKRPSSCEQSEQASDAEAAYDEASRYYQAGDLDAATTALDRARSTLDQVGEITDCAEIRSRIERAGEVIERLRRALAAIDVTIRACNVREMNRVAGKLTSLKTPHRLLVEKARILDRVRNAAGEAAALIDAAREPFAAKRFDEVERLVARATAKLDEIADLSRCPDLRARIAQISTETATPTSENSDDGGEVDVAHFVISVKGRGFTPHWAGASFEKDGMDYRWLTIPIDADHDQAKKDYKNSLLSGGCEATSPPGFPGFAEPPHFWQRGPRIETIDGPLVSRGDFKQELIDTWKILRDDGPPLSVLKGKVRGAGDCG